MTQNLQQHAQTIIDPQATLEDRVYALGVIANSDDSDINILCGQVTASWKQADINSFLIAIISKRNVVDIFLNQKGYIEIDSASGLHSDFKYPIMSAIRSLEDAASTNNDVRDGLEYIANIDPSNFPDYINSPIYDSSIPASAVYALGEIQDERNVKFLTDVLNSNNHDHHSKNWAIDALVKHPLRGEKETSAIAENITNNTTMNWMSNDYRIPIYQSVAERAIFAIEYHRKSKSFKPNKNDDIITKCLIEIADNVLRSIDGYRFDIKNEKTYLRRNSTYFYVPDDNETEPNHESNAHKNSMGTILWILINSSGNDATAHQWVRNNRFRQALVDISDKEFNEAWPETDTNNINLAAINFEKLTEWAGENDELTLIANVLKEANLKNAQELQRLQEENARTN